MRRPVGPTRSARDGEALAAEGGAPGRVVVQGALQVRLLVELRVHTLMVLGEREGRESVCVCVCAAVCVGGVLRYWAGCVRGGMRGCVCVCVCVCACACACKCLCVHACMCVCVGGGGGTFVWGFPRGENTRKMFLPLW